MNDGITKAIERSALDQNPIMWVSTFLQHSYFLFIYGTNVDLHQRYEYIISLTTVFDKKYYQITQSFQDKLPL